MQNVLVEFYAPWYFCAIVSCDFDGMSCHIVWFFHRCQHCQKFAPVYDKLAKTIAAKYVAIGRWRDNIITYNLHSTFYLLLFFLFICLFLCLFVCARLIMQQLCGVCLQDRRCWQWSARHRRHTRLPHTVILRTGSMTHTRTHTHTHTRTHARTHAHTHSHDFACASAFAYVRSFVQHRVPKILL